MSSCQVLSAAGGTENAAAAGVWGGERGQRPLADNQKTSGRPFCAPPPPPICGGGGLKSRASLTPDTVHPQGEMGGRYYDTKKQQAEACTTDCRSRMGCAIQFGTPVVQMNPVVYKIILGKAQIRAG